MLNCELSGLRRILPENERMDRLGSADILLFEGFRLDRSGGGLFRLNQPDFAAPVALGSRALDLLGLLVERQGELVSKDVIMDAVWPRMVVEEGNLTVHISALRRILDQNREDGSCIQTVPGRGYRFVAPVTRVEPATGTCEFASRRSAAPPCPSPIHTRPLHHDLAGYPSPDRVVVVRGTGPDRFDRSVRDALAHSQFDLPNFCQDRCSNAGAACA